MVSAFHLILVTILLKRLQQTLCQNENPVVELQKGSLVQGTVKTLPTSKILTEFIGIPFAEPPIGNHRFKPPIEKTPWASVYIANHEVACHQAWSSWYNPKNVSEDCLYLNVWVPGRLGDVNNSSVMVWIHGGGFYAGSIVEDQHYGGVLSTEENIIVVSMNYRLLVLGFLYSGIPEAPGNAGLLDQLLALKWVNKYINKFGGNPDKVTIFGNSAGACSVGFHVLSPLSQQYYKRYIMESGSPIATWPIASVDKMKRTVLNLAAKVNCTDDSKNSEIDWTKVTLCLKQVDPKLLTKMATVTTEFTVFSWTPVVDNYFLTDEPTNLFDSGLLHKSEALLGSVKYELNGLLVGHFSDIYKKELLSNESYEFIPNDDVFKQLISQVLPRKYIKKFLENVVHFEYKNWTVFDSFTRQNSLNEIGGDFYFTCDVISFAKKCEFYKKPAFYYIYAHEPVNVSRPKWFGPVHGEEVSVVFGTPVVGPGFTEKEKRFSRQIMRYWANFARSGNPNVNPDGSNVNFEWPRFGTDDNYLILSGDELKTGKALKRKQCAFWKEYVPAILEELGRCNVTGT